MTAAEFELLKKTHDKVDALSEAFLVHVAKCESGEGERLSRRQARTAYVAAFAAWAAVGASVLQLFLRH